MLSSKFASILALALLATAAPAPVPAPEPEVNTLEARTVTTLGAAQVSSFKPYTYYAATGYCSPASTLAWNCGANCNANSGFKPVASGGDGASIQYWFVGYDPALRTVIVSHQGTDASKIIPVLTDADFGFDGFDSTLFPGLSSSIEGHNGFIDQHAKTATAVLAAVQKAISTYSATQVTLVGHSLGAALSLIEAVYLPLHLPSTITFKSYLYGLPRVGNQAFADYVDSKVKGITRITNKKDPVPIIPGRFLGFHHPTGETHVRESNGAWVSCSGQDNTETGCTIDDVPNILVADTDDHSGPYDGVYTSCD